MYLDILKLLIGTMLLMPLYHTVDSQRIERLIIERSPSLNWIFIFAMFGFALIINAIL